MKLSNSYVLALVAVAMGTTVFITSCQKDQDNDTPTKGITQEQNQDNSNSFTITSQDGHVIGINGAKTDGRGKQSTSTINGCGAASNLVISAISNQFFSDGSTGCVLSNSWTGGGGECIALFINGQPYKDGNSGYGLWTSSCTGIAAEGRLIAGGINGGETFNNFVRTYCNADTTGSPYFDSPIMDYTVASNFQCSTIPPVKGKKHGHMKDPSPSAN